MRDLVMFAGMLVMLPLALTNGFVAYLFWGWTALFSPLYYLYGFMQPIRYNLVFAIITILLVMLGRIKQRGQFTQNRTSTLLVIFFIHSILCALLSRADNVWNWDIFENFAKSMVFCLMMPLLVTGRLRIHAFVVMLALGLGFHGIVEGLKVVVTGGAHRVTGLTTMMSDNNHFAVGMVMVMPLLFYLYFHSEKKMAKLAAASTILLTALSIMGTQSRGGFLCLSIVLGWYVLTSRRKFFSLFVMTLVGGVILYFAPDSWFDRMDSIQNADENTSFLGRVIAWKVSTALAFDYPIFGGGFHAIQSFSIWMEYINKIDFLSFITTPAPEYSPRAAHSIYFEILGDLGFLGLGLFIALLVNGFYTARDIRQLVASNASLIWARDLSDGLRLGLVAYCIGGAAVSLGYFELFYVSLMFLEVLKQFVIKAIHDEALPQNTERSVKQPSIARLEAS